MHSLPGIGTLLYLANVFRRFSGSTYSFLREAWVDLADELVWLLYWYYMRLINSVGRNCYGRTFCRHTLGNIPKVAIETYTFKYIVCISIRIKFFMVCERCLRYWVRRFRRRLGCEICSLIRKVITEFLLFKKLR